MSTKDIPRITKSEWSDARGPGTPVTVAPSSISTLPPAYSETDTTNHPSSPYATSPPSSTASTASTSESSLPNYANAAGPAADFAPTTALHVRASGKPVLSLPVNTAPTPIAIFPTDAAAITHSSSVDPAATPAYLSLRRSRCSSSAWLVRGDDPNATPLCSTLYTFGPRRAPHIRLLRAPSADAASMDDPLDWGAAYKHDMQVRRGGFLTRARVISSPYGLFRWRYASRKERDAHPARPDSLLVMEKLAVRDASRAGGKEKGEEGEEEGPARKVAELIRSEQTRTPGTSRSTAGNGGLLRMDLREWIGGGEKGGEGKEEEEEEEVRQLVVAGALMMLKREVDRRRAQQAAAMGAIAGGGP